MLVRLLFVDEVGVDTLLDSGVVLDCDKAVLECFSRSHGSELHVLTCAVSLLV